MPLGPNGYDMSVMNKFRSLRFNQSIATNPYMFNGPYTGLFGQTATFLFTYQMFKNHSAAYPDGYLDGNTLKSFFGVTGNNGSFQWQPGYERIPDNVRTPSSPHAPRGRSHVRTVCLLMPCFNFTMFNSVSSTR